MATFQVSPEQLEANRLNAQKSTGPTTQEGKARSSRNSTTHGLTGRVNPQSPEDRLAYAEQGKRLIADWKPIGEQEEQLVRVILDSGWQMNRARAHDERLWRQIENPDAPGPSAEASQLTLDKVTRYEAHHTRTYFRAISELRKQQAVRRAAELVKLKAMFMETFRHPYSLAKHGPIPLPDRFVSSSSPCYNFFDTVATESMLEIEANSAADNASPAADAA
jgi:hypothetical protein